MHPSKMNQRLNQERCRIGSVAFEQSSPADYSSRLGLTVAEMNFVPTRPVVLFLLPFHRSAEEMSLDPLMIEDRVSLDNL